MTHSNVRVVAAYEDLSALHKYATVSVYTGIDDRFFAAGADRLDLGDRVSHFKKSLAAVKQVGHKVGSETEAEHGYVVFVDDAAELIDLRYAEKLTFVSNDRVNSFAALEFVNEIGIGRYDKSVRLDPNTRMDLSDAVSVVKRGLNEPNSHSALLVIKFRYKRVCRFGGAHSSVFKIKLCHFLSPFCPPYG